MCLIMTGQAHAVRSTLLDTPRLAGSIYNQNSDGVGVMYKNKRGLKVIKLLPKSTKEVAEFLLALPDDDRNLAIHWRMRTHGHVDMHNCHPYPVAKGVAMMHNGILSTGNKADPTKSDTYHFIEDYLRTAVESYPELVHDAGFLEMVSDYIGASNRFVFMSADGRMSTANFNTGIEHNGVWFSNTYAWPPELLIPDYKPRWVYTSGTNYELGADDDERGENWAYDSWHKQRKGGNYTVLTHHKKDSEKDGYEKLPVPMSTGRGPVPEPKKSTGELPGYWTQEVEDHFLNAVLDYDQSEIEFCLRRWPFSTTDALCKRLGAYPVPLDESVVTEDEQSIVQLLEDGAKAQLNTIANARPTKLAYCIAQLMFWYDPAAPGAKDVAAALADESAGTAEAANDTDDTAPVEPEEPVDIPAEALVAAYDPQKEAA